MACVMLAVAPFPAARAAEAPPTALEEDIPELEEVVVYGTDGRLVTGLAAESELDANAIAGYGANTIGDLLTQLSQDVENTEEGPIILINGKPANGIRSVNDLPPEAVANVQVLPPQAAAALGYAPTRRVINVVLKQEFRTGIGNLSARMATAGQGFSSNGNLSLVHLIDNRMRNVSVTVARDAPLWESQRRIVSDPGPVPYDLIGNVLSSPIPGGEIDPQLSALAGRAVTVLGVPPGLQSPTLGALAPYAGLTNTSDMGRYRTLVGDQMRYGINMNYSRPLPLRSAMSFNLNADRRETASRTGATPALLTLPASSPYSPFSRDVAMARYLGEPLRQDSTPMAVNFTGNLNTQQGKWRYALDTTFNWRASDTVSQRRVDTAALQSAITAGLVNPFDALPDDLLGDYLTDRARSRGYNGGLTLQAMGSPWTLPTGKVDTTVRIEYRRSEQHSRNTGTAVFRSDRVREDRVGSGTLQIPLLGNPQSRDRPSLGAQLSAAVRDVTGSGSLFDYTYGFNYRLGNRLTLGGSLGHQEVAPQPEQLNAPLVTVDNYRAYDFIREETVLVRYITGGNPDLDVEKRRLLRFNATWRPMAKTDLNLNAEYQRTIGRHAVAQLPPVSADVQAAFPDRYRRDAQGRLFEIDARPVSFERSLTEQLRWGANYRGVFRAPPAAPPTPGAPRIVFGDAQSDLDGSGWRVSGNFNHVWRLSNTRRVRSGLPVVDLLRGGISGYTAQPRHEVQGRVGVAHSGTGLQINFQWRGASRLEAGTSSSPSTLEFASFLRADLSAFTNLDTLLPGRAWAKSTRINLGVDNLFDAKQRVRDQNDVTPLRYQPYLLNPLGRVVGLSVRRNF